jgi:hypothetical protein
VMKSGPRARADSLSPSVPQNLNWFSRSRGTGSRHRIDYAPGVGSERKRVLANGIGIAIGECTLAVNGPFLLNRFGLNVPEAAAVGCAVGAAVGYGLANMASRCATERAPIRRCRHMPTLRSPMSRLPLGTWAVREYPRIPPFPMCRNH